MARAHSCISAPCGDFIQRPGGAPPARSDGHRRLAASWHKPVQERIMFILTQASYFRNDQP